MANGIPGTDPEELLGPPLLALAPMDGVTDWAFRDLLTRLSTRDHPESTVSNQQSRTPTPSFADHPVANRAASTNAIDGNAIDWCVSEFVRISHRPAPAKLLRRACPELENSGCTRSGVAVHLQLLGGDPEPIAETAKLAVDLGASGIDLNFGCPAKTVNRHDGGASLLRHPQRLEGIVCAVRKAIDPKVPVSAKIRTGWDDHRAVRTLARSAEAGGASWLTVHGRTRAEGYGPAANWDAIGEARDAVGIPVVANGDLNSAGALERCAFRSGCDAFMLGRGAMARPQIFGEIRGWITAHEHLALSDILLQHAELLIANHASSALVVRRTKQWLCLAAKIDPDLLPLFESIKRLDEIDVCLRTLAG
jgi:tRNA-dihydrouridine synthase C